MKKSLIYTTATSLALLAGVTTTVLINNASAETTHSDNSVVAALTDQTSLGTAITTTKNETVYVITDAAGTPGQVFIGNTLDTSDSTLPVAVAISYSLDGSAISSTDLAGKSGHVKITFDYTSSATYQGKDIPFIALTGLQLDNTKFTNVKITNGKIISENDSLIIAGYALAGVNADLGVDFLPETFSIEADVTDFELGTTYTITTNELFADLDTSKLSTVDDLISSMDQLGSGIDQILTGASALDAGIGQLASGITQLQSGATTLSDGAHQLADNLTYIDEQIDDNLVSQLKALIYYLGVISDGSTALNNSIQNSFSTILSHLQDVANNTTDDDAKAALEQFIAYINMNLPTLYSQLKTYTGVVDTLAARTANLDLDELTNGITALANGANALAAGSDQLKDGIDQLAGGANQLQAGSTTLKNGIATFKSEGIDRLVNFATNDLANFTANARATVTAAQSYHHYKSPSAESVKFIFKTPSIK